MPHTSLMSPFDAEVHDLGRHSAPFDLSALALRVLEASSRNWKPSLMWIRSMLVMNVAVTTMLVSCCRSSVHGFSVVVGNMLPYAHLAVEVAILDNPPGVSL